MLLLIPYVSLATRFSPRRLTVGQIPICCLVSSLLPCEKKLVTLPSGGSSDFVEQQNWPDRQQPQVSGFWADSEDFVNFVCDDLELTRIAKKMVGFSMILKF